MLLVATTMFFTSCNKEEDDETFEYTVAFVRPTGNLVPAYESIGLIGFALTGDDTGWEDGKDVAMASSDLQYYYLLV